MYKTFITDWRDKAGTYYLDDTGCISGVYENEYISCMWKFPAINENFKSKYWVKTNHKVPEIVINKGVA